MLTLVFRNWHLTALHLLLPLTLNQLSSHSWHLDRRSCFSKSYKYPIVIFLLILYRLWYFLVNILTSGTKRGQVFFDGLSLLITRILTVPASTSLLTRGLRGWMGDYHILRATHIIMKFKFDISLVTQISGLEDLKGRFLGRLIFKWLCVGKAWTFTSR